MKYIDEGKIEELLKNGKRTSAARLDAILRKSKALKRLTLPESAALLQVNDHVLIKKIFQAASLVKERIYGKRVVLFAPLYISNLCSNACLYCAFKSDNLLTRRKALSIAEIKAQVRWLLKRGHKRILLVCGEAAPGQKPIDYYVKAVKAIYEVSAGPHKIKRVNANVAPLTVAEFKRLKAARIGTYQCFQETYHEATYRKCHPVGPKSDPDNRMDGIDRAFLAGIDDVGLGVLYGLYDWRFDTLGMLMHVEHLEKRFGVGPHTISVPRIEPAAGVSFTENLRYKVSDDDFRKIVAVLRLSVPYTGIILSTRESASLRDELFSLGVSQISAESRTSPGGYNRVSPWQVPDAQFSLNDTRTLDEIIGSLLERNFIPSFCAACYRLERTGKAFMNLARPGTIKGKCRMNALVTLKEYLDDFASSQVKHAGYLLIDKLKKELDKKSLCQLSKFFGEVDRGKRDKFV